MAGTVKFETRIKELVGNSPELAALVEPLLVVRRVCQRSNDDPRRRSCGGTDLSGPPSTCPLGFENPSQSVPCLD